MRSSKYKLVFFIMVLSCLVIGISIFWWGGRKKQPQYDVFDRIATSPCVKFERLTSDGVKYEPLIIVSESYNLANFFCSLNIKEGDIPIGEITYRITFRCREIMIEDKEIVILIGDKAMSIDGVVYVMENESMYTDFKQIVYSKWKYFNDQK